MHKTLLLLLFCFSAVLAEDRSLWTEINGEYSWPHWKIESGWQKIESDFEHDEKLIEQISKVENISFILFTAAWCPDSRVGTPKVIDLLEKTGHYPTKFKLYGLDRDKNEPAGNNYIYEIKKVPTLIILKDGKEIGRIVEYPEKSWTEDIMSIIRNED